MCVRVAIGYTGAVKRRTGTRNGSTERTVSAWRKFTSRYLRGHRAIGANGHKTTNGEEIAKGYLGEGGSYRTGYISGDRRLGKGGVV